MSPFERAAAQGHNDAAGQLGWAYENGFGTPASAEAAMAWYEKAAAAGDEEARYRLGLVRWRAAPGLLWSQVTDLLERLLG